MKKKQYCIPEIEIIETDELCETGMNSNSYDTSVDKAAEDQTDVNPDKPDVEEEPLTPPSGDWGW